MSTALHQHLAAILKSKGSFLELIHRPTPTPGPDELLIEVKSIALNPADHAQRDLGILIASYPIILGSDVAGIVISTGSSVSPQFKAGDRVLAFVSAYFENSNLDYGAFQTRVLAKEWMTTPLPDSMSFSEGAMMPMAVSTSSMGMYTLGIYRDMMYSAADKRGMLVWGGASSIGSATLQTAKLKGFRVYATASPKNHELLKSLGASHVFDYHDVDVVEKIVKTAKEEGIILDVGFDAVGQLQSCLDILKEFRADGKAKLAEAIPQREDSIKEEGVEVGFKVPWNSNEAQREHFQYTFNIWLKEKLEKGKFVPSPRLQVVEGGLESLDKYLDVLKAGVSGVKLVLEI
ncbi:hypothetical protein EG329_003953 [Mollisiaceae sp. DMI_Dod_QoI]|nr:hypothetical protein EG329_003953 [Helotiales sp. DMI_Dod_QoI]